MMKDWLVLCDYNVDRAEEVRVKVGSPAHMPVEFIDASDKEQIKGLAAKHQVDPDPFMDLMPSYGFPYGLKEMSA